MFGPKIRHITFHFRLPWQDTSSSRTFCVSTSSCPWRPSEARRARWLDERGTQNCWYATIVVEIHDFRWCKKSTSSNDPCHCYWLFHLKQKGKESQVRWISDHGNGRLDFSGTSFRPCPSLREASDSSPQWLAFPGGIARLRCSNHRSLVHPSLGTEWVLIGYILPLYSRSASMQHSGNFRSQPRFSSLFTVSCDSGIEVAICPSPPAANEALPPAWWLEVPAPSETTFLGTEEDITLSIPSCEMAWHPVQNEEFCVPHWTNAQKFV